MIVTLEGTTSAKISTALVKARRSAGSPAMGMVLTLIIVAEQKEYADALQSSMEAGREHPSRILLVVTDSSRTPKLDAEVRIGEGTPGEVIVVRMSGAIAGHPASVIRPLLLPDSPVVIWWPGKCPANPARIVPVPPLSVSVGPKDADPCAALPAGSVAAPGSSDGPLAAAVWPAKPAMRLVVLCTSAPCADGLPDANPAIFVTGEWNAGPLAAAVWLANPAWSVAAPSANDGPFAAAGWEAKPAVWVFAPGTKAGPSAAAVCDANPAVSVTAPDTSVGPFADGADEGKPACSVTAPGTGVGPYDAAVDEGKPEVCVCGVLPAAAI